MKKISLLSLLLGILCILISLFMFGFSFVGLPATRHTRLVMSLCYVGVGFSLLLFRVIIEWFSNRPTLRRHRTHHSSHGNAQLPPKNPLPTRKSGMVPALARNEEGAALVLVLILLSLIAGLVVETQISARIALRREQTALLQTRLQQAASDAAWGALRRLADDEDLTVDHTNEAWAATEETTDPSGISTRVTVTDQNRYFDLNNLALQSTNHLRPAADVAMDLMTLCGDFAPVDRVEALTDWIDSNDDGFAEKAFYKEKAPPYEAANRPMYTWSELLWVNGFSRAYFDRHERSSALEPFNADLVDCLTVLPGAHNSATPINVNTAGREVLLGILGMTQEGLVQYIKTYRGTQPIHSIDRFFTQAIHPISKELQPYLDVKSHFFSVDAQAYAEGHREHIVALVQRDSKGNVDVLQWVL